MRARGFVILAFLSTISTLAACAASPGGQSFSDDKGGDDNGADSGWHPTQGGGGGGGGGVLLPDGGELLPDGAVITPPKGDGGFLGDGSAPTTRLSCGGSYCRGDQTCNAGSCQFACVGTNVPGDYATIQAAINANAGTSDLTICLKAQNYPETVSATSSPATPKNLTIIGVSSSVSSINAMTFEYAPFSNIAIRGVSITTGINLDYLQKPIQFVGCKITTTSYTAVTIEGAADVLIDGCDVSSNASYPAINDMVYPVTSTSIPGSQKLVVQNSYVHDSYLGVELSLNQYFSSGSAPTATVNVINDTFNNNSTAIQTGGSYEPVTFTYANNLIVNDKTYGIDQEATQETITTKNNALFGNTNNYSGSAVDGPSYVKADVKLDSTQNPPGLSADSPARGAADSTMAPSTDFWGVARSSSTDIGAIQN